VDVLPVVLGFLGIVAGLHGLLTFIPLGRADLTELVSVLEGLEESEDFIDVSSDGSVVDGDVSQDTLIIDDVSGSEGDVLLGDEASVGLGDALVDVSKEGDVHITETSFISGFLAPFHMGELGVNGGTDDFAVSLSELFGLVGELDDFSGADKGEIQRIEEKDNPLALVVRELDVFEALLGVDVGVLLEFRSGGKDLGDREFRLGLHDFER